MYSIGLCIQKRFAPYSLTPSVSHCVLVCENGAFRSANTTSTQKTNEHCLSYEIVAIQESRLNAIQNAIGLHELFNPDARARNGLYTCHPVIYIV